MTNQNAFGRPNAAIGWKMANGRLLFLVLCVCVCVVYMCVLLCVLLCVCVCASQYKYVAPIKGSQW